MGKDWIVRVSNVRKLLLGDNRDALGLFVNEVIDCLTVNFYRILGSLTCINLMK